MKKYNERVETLLQALKHKNRLGIDEVVALLDISESTARRLFSDLESKGQIIRTFGGIKLHQNDMFDYSFDQLEQKNIAEKKRIATYAASLIKDNAVLFIDSGTTNLHLAIALANRISSGTPRDIKVFTSSLAGFRVLAEACEVILIGGKYRSKRKDFAGYASEKYLQFFNFTQCFLGADGLDLRDGFMTTDIDTARLSEMALSRSEEVTFLLDSTKFSRRSFIRLCSFEDVNQIITDTSLDADTRLQFERAGLQIKYV